MSNKVISVFDSTLRDGSQGEGISYSVQDKIHICQALDRLGIDFIEAGNPGSNPKDYEFFQEIQKINFQNSAVKIFAVTDDVSFAVDDAAVLKGGSFTDIGDRRKKNPVDPCSGNVNAVSGTHGVSRKKLIDGRKTDGVTECFSVDHLRT